MEARDDGPQKPEGWARGDISQDHSKSSAYAHGYSEGWDAALAARKHPEPEWEYGALVAELRGFAEGSTSARASLMRDAADAIEGLRKHPEPEITDEMVERAALKVFADNWSDSPDMERAKRRWDRDPEHYMATYGAQARAYLEAALRVPDEEGENRG